MEILENYILEHIDEEGPLLARLRREANVNLLRPRMLSGHLQGRLLKMICRISSPEKILEIGTYTGYATLCMAEALPENGAIHTIEVNDELEDFILQQFNESADRQKIRLHIGDALEIIPELEETFDLVFIDGDKREYCAYYDRVFDQVRPGGLIIADNTLWDGKVVEEVPHNDKQTHGILEFNEKIKADDRIEKVIVPIRDGLTLIYKKHL